MICHAPPPAAALMELHPDLLLRTSVRSTLFEIESWGAIFSPDEHNAHRYMLWRVWDQGLPLFIALMLNPSKADELANDNTVAGICKRAKAMGFGGVLVINCFAFRATDPTDMKKARDPVGAANDDAISIACDMQDAFLLCAWGVNATHMNRNEDVKCLIRNGKARANALELSSEGHPKHPLYLPHALQPFEWSAIYEDAS